MKQINDFKKIQNCKINGTRDGTGTGWVQGQHNTKEPKVPRCLLLTSKKLFTSQGREDKRNPLKYFAVLETKILFSERRVFMMLSIDCEKKYQGIYETEWLLWY